MSIQENRLESHRKRFLAENRTGPLLRFSDLSPSELDTVRSDVFMAASLNSFQGMTSAQSSMWVLHSWGIMCPHPISARTYDGVFSYNDGDSLPSFEDSNWYGCSVCECIVLNR